MTGFWAEDQDQADLPPHLRDDAPEATCGRCGRTTWDPEMFGQEDRMTQPDGFPCGGRFSDPKTDGVDLGDMDVFRMAQISQESQTDLDA